MSSEILIFGHKNPDTDSICSSMVKEILCKKEGIENVRAIRLGKINKETKFVLDYLKLDEPELCESAGEKQKVILVDHNEFVQSIEGIENATIIEVVDHHKIANFQTSEPLLFTAKPYGCTSTILYFDFLEKGIKVEKTEAILMLSAIVSDTLLLKSPTTTAKDVMAVKELEKIAGIDVNVYGLDMLKAGTNLDDFSGKELIEIDAKETGKDNVKMVIAQVNTVDIESVVKRQLEIETEMINVINEKELSIFIFVITDIVNTNSELIVLGNGSEFANKAYGKVLNNNRMFLEGVVSRKKQLLPQILDVI